MAMTNRCIWPSKKLRDCIVQLNTGLNPRDNFTLGMGNIKYITAKNLTDVGTIDFTNCDYIDTHAKEIVHRRSDIQKGDILFGSRAPIGHCHLLTEDPDDFAVGESIFCIRVNRDAILPEYLCLYLSSKHFVEMASKRVTGSVIKEIRIADLLDTDVILPPEDIQAKIARCVGEIDKKTANNTAICSDLEAMAKLLYDYWFVQFDFPDENGKPYKSSGGKMTWNEELKREIPEGWEVQKIGDIIYTERGISYSTPNIATGEGVPMLNLATFMPGGGDYKADGLKHFLGDYPKSKTLKPYDLIMCNTQQTAIKFETDIIGRAMLTPDVFDGDVVFSHHVNVIRTDDESLKYYLLFLFNSNYFHKYISGFTNGTNILGLSFNGVEDYLLEIPSHDLLTKFGAVVLEMEKKKSAIFKENQQLGELRDFLLPMLMNGQVKVGGVVE